MRIDGKKVSAENVVARVFESSSSSKTYTTMIDTVTGAASCNCPGWTFKRKNSARWCKHTKALGIEFGFLAGTVKKSVATEKALSVSPAQLAKSQAQVEELVGVRGSRQITFDDEDEPTTAPATPQPAPGSEESPGNGCPIKPMLASAMKAEQRIESFDPTEWALEEKLDGHRVLVRVADGVEAWSRPGIKGVANVRDLPPGLEAEVAQLPQGVYDGELCVPGGTSSDVSRIDKASELVLVMFDVVEVLSKDVTAREYVDRRALLALAVATANVERVLVAKTHELAKESVNAIWEAGGEGAIIKRLVSKYQPGRRSPDWVKVKREEAAELTIIGFKRGKNGPKSVACLRDDDGRETTCKVLTNAQLEAVEADPESFVGKRLVISFMGRTASGLYRHPVWDHVL